MTKNVVEVRNAASMFCMVGVEIMSIFGQTPGRRHQKQKDEYEIWHFR